MIYQSKLKQFKISNPVNRLGFWSSAVIVVLVLLIDAGMILSTMFFPMTSVTTIEEYASSFSSVQMLPFIPSLVLAPAFVALMVSIHYSASEERKILNHLGLSLAIICAAILSIHYYIQLSVVQQGLLNGDLTGLWQLVAPNPYSLFWTLAALGYGFMGFSLLAVSPTFNGRSERTIRWLFIANGLIGIAFLVGNAMGIFIVNILSSFIWGVLFPIACLMLANYFRRLDKSKIENRTVLGNLA